MSLPFNSRMLQCKSIVVLLFTLGCFQANAQQITGSVKDGEGSPLAFASVFVSKGGAGTVANAEGNFSLRLDAGTHTITCAYVGYQKVQQTITQSWEIWRRVK